MPVRIPVVPPKNIHVACRITEDMHNAIKVLMKKYNIEKSSVMRYLIEVGLAEVEKENKEITK